MKLSISALVVVTIALQQSLAAPTGSNWKQVQHDINSNGQNPHMQWVEQHFGSNGLNVEEIPSYEMAFILKEMARKGAQSQLAYIYANQPQLRGMMQRIASNGKDYSDRVRGQMSQAIQGAAAGSVNDLPGENSYNEPFTSSQPLSAPQYADQAEAPRPQKKKFFFF